MKLTRALITAAALCLAATAHAHDCSGGTDGGMDATGNQCNDKAPVTASVPARAPAAVRPAGRAASAVPATTAGARERLARATAAQGR